MKEPENLMNHASPGLPRSDLTDVLYITCSSYSGSTLLSFMLNEHPEIVTVGHTTGWQPAPDRKFYCSCGELLGECPFFREIGRIFDERGLPHDIGDFSTNYRLASNLRLNRYLVAELPIIRNALLERLRDTFVGAMPSWRRQLAIHDAANLTFMQAALRLSNSTVYVDNSHRPYRMRRLGNLPGIRLSVIHLVRDFRGVVLSTMNRRNWDARLAMESWLGEQSDSARIMVEFARRRVFFYEDLCDSADEALATLHRFVGLEPHPFSGDFKSSEHHILGNVMRLRGGKVEKDLRWQTDLSQRDLATITETGKQFVARNPGHPVSAIVEHYLEPTNSA